MSYKRSRMIMPGIIFGIMINILALMGNSKAWAASKTVDIEFLSHAQGSFNYVMAFAFADIVNQYSKRLHISSVETAGPAENLSKLAVEPEKRGMRIIHSTTLDNYFSSQGTEGYKQKYKAALIGATAELEIGLVTINPDLKTIEDLAGKRVVVATNAGAGNEWQIRAILGDVFDKVDKKYMGFEKALQALVDGRIDATQAPCVEGKASPALMQLVSTKKGKCHFFFASPSQMENNIKKMGFPPGSRALFPSKVFEPGEIDPLITEKFIGGCISGGWWVDPQMDGEIVKECLRIISEHSQDLKNYHKAMTGWNAEHFASQTRELYHPAAVAFFEEKGIKMK